METDDRPRLRLRGASGRAIGGSAARGLKSFFDTFNEESFVARSLHSEFAKDMLVLPQLQNLLSDREIDLWGFPKGSQDLIRSLIADIESGALEV